MSSSNPYSVRTQHAAQLLGLHVQRARRARRWSEADLAARAGISRSTLRKVEGGDPGVRLGLAFELAGLVGVALFHDDDVRTTADIRALKDRIALLPRAVAPSETDVDDDF